MDLREYEQSKFAIAEVLRSASAHRPKQREDLRVRLHDLFARLAEDRFNLMVVGRFNRGKTSLMNAILGTDRLPTGIVPLTSVIATVGYGSRERAILKYDNRILEKEIPIEALPQYITQQGNPANVQGIKSAEIQLPAEILRRGVYFVDTPGLGSVIVENTLATEAFLPEADAFILVTSYESLLSEEEAKFFKAASSSGKRISVVLNKHDTVMQEQREAALGFVREQLEVFFGRSVPSIFSVSSTDALEAKLSRDRARLQASGLPQLEADLLSFVFTEKSREFLLRICDRVRCFLQELPTEAEVKGLITRIDTLAQQFSERAQIALTEPNSVSGGIFPGLHQLPTCEVCAHVAEKLWKFLCEYQYEIIISRDEQQHFADHGGFCPFHAWQYHSIASPYGICAGHAPVLDRLAATLRESASSGEVHLPNLLPDQDDCALCNVRDSAEREAVEAGAKRLEEDKSDALNALSAICLPHFVMLASIIRDSSLVRMMLQRQAALLERYSEDMKRFAIKHDGVRRYLASQEETTAAERALLLLAGRRQVNFAPQRGAVSNIRRAEKRSGK